MFSSTTSLNPFHSSSSSYADLSPYIIHHVPDQNPHDSILPLNSMQEIQVPSGDFLHQYGFGTSSPVSVAHHKRPPKKDRHSKIYTAQGLRDRRVRISIEIARKFFHLQDLLGFDKASKTLEWLLNKSNKAITELAQNDHINYNNNTPCEQVISAAEEEDEEDDNDDNVISKNEREIKRMKKKSAVASNLKELREKARARARERTRNKWLCNTKFNLDPSSKQSLLNHPDFRHQQPSSSSSKIVGEAPYSNTIGDSILIQRKSMMGYQQNLFFLKDANFPNLSPNPNWEDLNSHSAISSMNKSTGVHPHVHGKIWELTENSKWL